MRLFLFLLLFVHFEVVAQTLTLRGKITDSTGKAVEFAQIILYKSDKKSIITFTQSKTDGLFELQTPANGEATWLAIRAFGYKPFFADIPAFSQTATYTVNAVLEEEIQTIKEIVVKAKVPGIKQEGDTTTYQTEEFRTGTERNLEDLLRKLPGVSVTDEGDVYFKGKKIKKLFVEGDDLFDRDYKIGTKNISADMIDKIQAIEHFSETPNLKGVVDGNDTVLNVTLKGDKSKVFGELTAGGGIENRFDSKINLFYLRKKQKLFILGQSNNVGFSPYNLNAVSILNAASIGGVATNNLTNPVPLFIGIPQQFSYAGLTERRANLNQAAFANSNYFFKASEKLTIRWNTQLFSDKNQLFRQSNTDFLLQAQSFRLQENQQSQLRPQMLASSLYLLHTPSNKTRFEYTLVGNQTLRRYQNDLLYNINTTRNQDLAENAQDQSLILEHRLRYSTKLNDQQALLANITYSDFLRKENHHLISERFAPLFGRDSLQNNLQQQVGGAGKQGHSDLQWIIKKNEKIRFKWQAEHQFLQTRLSSGLALGDANGLEKITDSSFNNQGIFNSNAISLKGGTTLRLFSKISIIGDIAFKHQAVSYENQQSQINFLEPMLTFSTKYQKAVFNLSYTFTQKNPEIQHLTTGFVLNNYRTFQRGNATLQFLPTHNFNFICNLNDLERFQSLTLFGLLSRTNPFYGTENQIDKEFSFVSNRLFPSQTFFLANLAVDKYIHAWLSGFQWFNTFSYNASDNQANTFELSRNQFYAFSSKLQYRSVFDGIYNVEASAQWLFATARNNLLQDNTAANNTNLIYNLIQILQPASKRWKWIVLTERFEFRSNQNKQIYYFLDTEFAWDFKKPKMLLTLEVKNLFNVQQIEQLSFSNFAISANSQRLQSRWGLLKVQFKF